MSSSDCVEFFEPVANSPTFRVGCVPYVNARPLVHYLPPGIEVIYAPPSRLPQLLDSGEAQAILVSSIEFLRRPGACYVGGVCIGSDGPAESVRLFSEVPFNEIKSLRLDPASMTSNVLCQILLDTTFDVNPQIVHEGGDAQLMIGDRGMQEPTMNRYVLDLGSLWKAWTGLPFVWALWVGDSEVDPELCAVLRQALEEGLQNIDAVIEDAIQRSRWDPRVCSRYLRNTMRYELDEPALNGLQRFFSEAKARELINAVNALTQATAQREKESITQ